MPRRLPRPCATGSCASFLDAVAVQPGVGSSTCDHDVHEVLMPAIVSQDVQNACAISPVRTRNAVSATPWYRATAVEALEHQPPDEHPAGEDPGPAGPPSTREPAGRRRSAPHERDGRHHRPAVLNGSSSLPQHAHPGEHPARIGLRSAAPGRAALGGS